MKKTTMLLLALAAMISLSACNSAPKTETSSKRETAASSPESTESAETFAESADTAAESASASVEAAEPVSSEPEPSAETDTGTQPVVPPIEEFEYKHDDELGGMVITKYNGSVPMVIIPDEIDGEPVVAIGESAFDSKTSLESITMRDTVKSIGNSAFGGCSDLTDVKLSSSLETIGRNAFGACGFSEISLPESLKCIGKSAFHICENLKSITIPGNIKIIEDGVFEKCTNLETVIISEGITAIDSNAFNRCNIKNMTLPTTITRIDTNPTDPLPDGYVVSIDDRCFKKWGKEIVISYDDDSYTCDSLNELITHILTDKKSAVENQTESPSTNETN